MHNSESVLENMMHKIFCDFEIQTDHLISARQPHLVRIKKKKKKEKEKGENPPNSELCHIGRPQNKIKRKQKEIQVPRPCLRIKKLWNIKMMVKLIVIGALGTIPKSFVKRLRNQRRSGDDSG